MKCIQFFICTLLLSNSIIIMGSQAPSAAFSEKTPEEEKCMTWFNTTVKALPSVLQALQEEDQQVWNKGIKYTDNPEAIIRSRHNYVSAFIAQAQKSGVKIEYDQATIQSAVLKSVIAMHTNNVKITDKLSACMFVYTQLSKDEQATWKKDNYLKSPEEAHKVAQKFSKLAAAAYVQHTFIEPKDEEKTTKEIYDDKVETFKKMYTKAE